MRVVVALDSFKGSVSSAEAGHAVKTGILRADPEAEVAVRPLADGGEGTMRALTEGLGGSYVTVSVTGPYGSPVEAVYGIVSGKGDKLAVIEMAEAAGITLVQEAERDPLRATTRGVGELILDAVKRGCSRFLIGIGGSATNDGGTGMLRALGLAFRDRNGRPVREGAAGLGGIETIIIEDENIFAKIRECSFQIACDVKNPLCGLDGATYVYGPQKGMKEYQKEAVDRAMAHYAGKTAAYTGTDCRQTAGAGAAGGLGFAFLSYLHAELRSGISLVIEATGLEEAVRTADYVITGEGRLDAQTAMGKAPAGVAALAKRCGAKVIALVGSVAPGANEACRETGIDACFSILPEIMTLEDAMRPERTKENLAATAEQLFRLLHS